MEVLGFIETPGTTTSSTITWVDTATNYSQEEPALDGPIVPSDPFDGWRPQELGSRFFKGRIRWGVVTLVAGILALAVGGGLWMYQRPQVDARNSRQEVLAGISELTPELARLQALSQTLTGASIDAVEVNSVMLALDAAVRRLFGAGTDLSVSEGQAKTRLFDATGDTADILRLFGDAYAYRSGVIPILAAPTLETDPGLVSLEQAAAAFSQWQAHFEEMRAALPEAALPQVTEALDVLSARLPALQREYLDALGVEDVEGSANAVNRLEEELVSIEETLFDGLALIQMRIDDLVREAEAALDGVVSLFG